MYIKTFNNEADTNAFIDTVVLAQEHPIQFTGDHFVVFYEATKDNYQDTFIDRMLSGLKNNLFHEQVRKASVDAEVEVFKDKGGKSDDFDEALKRQREAEKNIQLFESKIAALEQWKANSSSSK